MEHWYILHSSLHSPSTYVVRLRKYTEGQPISEVRSNGKSNVRNLEKEFVQESFRPRRIVPVASSPGFPNKRVKMKGCMR